MSLCVEDGLLEALVWYLHNKDLNRNLGIWQLLLGEFVNACVVWHSFGI